MIQEDGGDKLSSWEMSTASVVQKIVDSSNSMAAIQGTFRMSGLFAKKKDDESSKEGVVRTLSSFTTGIFNENLYNVSTNATSNAIAIYITRRFTT